MLERMVIHQSGAQAGRGLLARPRAWDPLAGEEWTVAWWTEGEGRADDTNARDAEVPLAFVTDPHLSPRGSLGEAEWLGFGRYHWAGCGGLPPACLPPRLQ